MKTLTEIREEIELLDQLYYRYDAQGHDADANMMEAYRDDLVEVAENMKADQLADVDHLFIV